MVNLLIDEDKGWWDQNVIEDLFDEEELKAIKSIPLSSTNQEDRMIWKGTINGLFSVRNAYHLAKEMEDRMKAGSSNESHKSEIWNLRVPNM